MYEQPPRGTPLYRAQHVKVANARGKACNYACADCGHPAAEWSWCHGSDPDDIHGYEPRCFKCHDRYDGSTHAMHEAGAKSRSHLAQRGIRKSWNKSGIPNIAPVGESRKPPWRVYFFSNGKQIHGGYFETLELALIRRNDLAVKVHGLNAKTYDIEGNLLSD